MADAAASLSPTWRPPKAPLPPHRLAKLANALGVSTPVPASLPAYRSYADAPDPLRRSPTPSFSSSSQQIQGPSTSKFLLHVVPPAHLPHDDPDADHDPRTPPPPSANGYHAHFRRGTLLPVHPTLQSQLAAIAREYALPSSAGLVLYLVSSSQAAADDPGPRLSEEVWRHLWTRVVRAEQRDDAGGLPSRSHTPVSPSPSPSVRSPFLLGMAASRSTPFLPQTHAGATTAYLRPSLPAPITTAPSTPSSASASDARSASKSASASEPGSPDTSLSPSLSARIPAFSSPSTFALSPTDDAETPIDGLDLPGLASPALIPILAKVEFDIDRRRAPWYAPWVRSRAANHAKRVEAMDGRRSASRVGRSGGMSRQGSGMSEDGRSVGGVEDSGVEAEEEREGGEQRHVPLEFLTGKKARDRALAGPFAEFLEPEPTPPTEIEDDMVEMQPEHDLEFKQPQHEHEHDHNEDEDQDDQDADADEIPDHTDGYAPLADADADADIPLSESPALLELERAASEHSSFDSDSDSDSNSGSDDDDDFDAEDATARVSVSTARTTTEAAGGNHGASDPDPLSDVFGDDADAWADIRGSTNANTNDNMNDNPNVVPLAITAAQLAALPDVHDLELDFDAVETTMTTTTTKEEDEVVRMLAMMGGGNGGGSGGVRPLLAISIPGEGATGTTTTTEPAATTKETGPAAGPTPPNARKIPPPLVLVPPARPVPPLPTDVGMGTPQTAGSTRLAYDSDEDEGDQVHAHAKHDEHERDGDDKNEHDVSGGDENEHDGDHDGDDFEFTTRVRSPAESDKRGGAVFSDLDLGLEPTEDFDSDDPNDRRRSQYIMSAQLDEIERTLASLSPRFMTTDLGDEQNANASFNSANLSFNSAALSASSPAQGHSPLSPGRSSFDFLPPSPRLPQHPAPPEEEQEAPRIYPAGQSWPAVPFSALKNQDNVAGPSADAPPSPPRLAVNGVTTSAPRSYLPPAARTAGAGPSESERRLRLQEEEEGLYAPPRQQTLETPTELVIPLSPDPFGRHPSTPEPPEDVRMSGSRWAALTVGGQGRPRSSTTSRFSADSIKAEDVVEVVAKTGNRATLISVKSIKNLWRKSNKSEKEKEKAANTAGSQAPPMPRPPTPTTSTSGRSSPMVPQRPERPSQDQLYLPDVPQMPPPPTPGRLSPLPPNTPIQEQMRPNSRTSLDQHSRQSLDQRPPTPQSAPANGRLSPMTPGLGPPSPYLPSQDQLYPGRRPSLDQHRGPVPPPPQSANNGRFSPQPPLGPPPLSRAASDPLNSGARTAPGGQMYPQGHMNRPSQDHQLMPPPRQSLDQLGPPGQPHHFQQLSIPSYPGRNPNAGPIITPLMQASKSASSLDRLHFDQESPYPSTRRNMPVRQSPRPPSPPALPAIPEQEKPSQEKATRKSILRWKSAASASTVASGSTQSSEMQPTPRTSFERPNAATGGRGRRPSVINFGSTRTSVTSPELPPSPQIPTQYSKSGSGSELDYRTSQRSQLTTSSTDSYSPPQRQASLGVRSASPSRSMASSRDSQGSRPSFDASQFEFVSPKTGSLTYPYNSLDHEP